MSIRRQTIKTLAIVLGGLLVCLVAAYLAFGWLILPELLQHQAEKYVAEKTGHRLTLDRPEFNPLTLHLRISNLRLTEPDGQPLLVFRELQVGLSAASLHRRALVFSDIRLDAPEATVTLLHDGHLNWSALIDALQGKQKKDESTAASQPRVDIEHFALVHGRVDFADKRVAFATRVDPLEIELNDISTLPDDKGGYKVSARTSFGARLEWQGQATLTPLALAGKIALDDVELARLAPYFKEALPVAPGGGRLTLSTDYRLAYDAGRIEFNLDDTTVKATGLRLAGAKNASPVIAASAVEIKHGRFDLARNSVAVGSLAIVGADIEAQRGGAPVKLLQHASLAIDDARIDLARRNLAIKRIALKDGQVQATRDALGHIDIADAVRAMSQSVAEPGAAETAAMKVPAQATMKTPAKSKAAVAPADTAWRYRIEQFELTGFSAGFSDQTVAPAASLALNGIALAANDFSDNLAAPLPVRAACRAPDGGTLEAAGQVIAANRSADIKLKLTDFSLKPLQPYLASFARLTLQSGLLSGDGELTYAKGVADFQGGFALRDLRLTETEGGDLFLAWKSLDTQDLEVGTAGLAIGDLGLDGLNTKLIINKDKSVNFSRIRTASNAAAAAPAPTTSIATTPAPSATGGKPASSYPVSVDRLQISRGEMDYADYSLALPFGTRIHHLHGALVGLSSRPGELTQIEVSGQVDDYGLARGVGQIDLFHPTDFMDITVQFQNVEMTRLTPYTATFAGRKIDSGKLSLDLQYKINKHRLAGDNRIIMEQLTLGERVESPTARDWPLDLAIAVLRDDEGRIDLGLPVSGNLDDPQFSYGGIIWKAIEDVFEKVVTAPFRLLGSLFGGGGGSDEKAARVVFDAGARGLTPPEREKLLRLVGALNKRPGMSLTVQGQYADADRVALQDRQLRRTVIEKTGEHLEGQGDPGPISTHAPKTQAALESLFSDRFGGAELTALKEGFRKANPGQLKEGVAGQVMSRLSGLLHPPRTVGDEEVAQMKDADFHALLFERLRKAEKIADSQLLDLAKARGEYALAALKTAGAPMDRLTLGSPEKVAAEELEVPLKLTPGTAPKPAG